MNATSAEQASPPVTEDALRGVLLAGERPPRPGPVRIGSPSMRVSIPLVTPTTASISTMRSLRTARWSAP